MERQAGADRADVHAGKSGNDDGHIFLDSLLAIGRSPSKIPQDACEVAPAPLQERRRFGGLQRAERPHVQVVDRHSAQRVTSRPELRETRHVAEIKVVPGAGRRVPDRALDHAPRLDPVGIDRTAIRPREGALLPEKHVAAPRLRPDVQGKTTLDARTPEVEVDAEVVRDTRFRAMKHFPDPAALAQGIAERRPQRIGDEAERVEEVALARAVRTDEERERRRRDIARGDALVVAQRDAGQQSAVRHPVHDPLADCSGGPDSGPLCRHDRLAGLPDDSTRDSLD